jgi:hypothetical protein
LVTAVSDEAVEDCDGHEKIPGFDGAEVIGTTADVTILRIVVFQRGLARWWEYIGENGSHLLEGHRGGLAPVRNGGEDRGGEGIEGGARVFMLEGDKVVEIEVCCNEGHGGSKLRGTEIA